MTKGVREAFTEPMNVIVQDGDVVVLGPDSIGVSLTPAAAEESGRRLLEAAAEARNYSGDALAS